MASLTFELCPGFEFERESRIRAMTTPASGGFVARGALVDRELRLFVFKMTGERSAMLLELKRRWLLALGCVRAMNFTPPGESAIEVQFEEDALARAFTSGQYGDAEFRLREVP